MLENSESESSDSDSDSKPRRFFTKANFVGVVVVGVVVVVVVESYGDVSLLD
jgi:hypothetical protein